jgi:hypothetical protein
MAIELVVFKTKDNGVTSDQVNRLKLSLDRERAVYSDGFQLTRLNVVTDDKTGIDMSAGVRVIPFLGEDKITNPSFLKILAHGGLDDMIHDGTKTMVIDANLVIRNLATSFIMDGLPDKGKIDETNYPFSKEERDNIIDNNLSCTEQTLTWWKEDDTSVFAPQYMGFVQGVTKDMYDLFMKDSVAIQEKYNTLQEWWEDTFTGFTIPVKLGLIGTYPINDEITINKYNKRYEEVVRPTFPEMWRGIGGDESARYIEIDHEYRDITKQTSLLFLEGEDDPFTDRYLQLWIL